jgi:hypothetical protein
VVVCFIDSFNPKQAEARQIFKAKEPTQRKIPKATTKSKHSDVQP